MSHTWVILCEIAANIPITTEWVVSACAFGGVWARLEHRLTKLETKIEDMRK